jgi:16S rRNA (uracil1498-N3)-methyltransferase
MPAERYFLEEIFKEREIFALKGSEFHHLAHVMRTRKGESVELVNGKRSLAQAIVLDLKKDRALLEIEHVFNEPEHPYRFILAQAIPKLNRLDIILEKGTELGVDCFWLFPGDYSVIKECYPSHLERARAVTISAMKQCGRLTLPSLMIQPAIEQWDPDPFVQMRVFFGDLDPKAPIFESAWNSFNDSSYQVVFITGPEGGFSAQEMAALKEKGAIGVKLHPNILRTDTASVMAMSLLSHWLLLELTLSFLLLLL